MKTAMLRSDNADTLLSVTIVLSSGIIRRRLFYFSYSLIFYFHTADAHPNEQHTLWWHSDLHQRPVDYFWLWTQEIWNGRSSTGVVGGLSSSAVTVVVEDFLAADAAAKAVNASFKLATCGWTLGPMEDRAYFDKVVPRDWTLSSIDEDLGNAGVEQVSTNRTCSSNKQERKKWFNSMQAEDAKSFAANLNVCEDERNGGRKRDVHN